MVYWESALVYMGYSIGKGVGICHTTDEASASLKEAVAMFEALNEAQQKQIISLLRTLALQQAQSPSVQAITDNTRI